MARLRVKLGGRKRFNKIIAGLRGVQSAIDRVTRLEEGLAHGRLVRHRQSGDHYVEVRHDKLDRIIGLHSRSGRGNPMAINFGHHQHKTGKYVPGLYILPSDTERGS